MKIFIYLAIYGLLSILVLTCFKPDDNCGVYRQQFKVASDPKGIELSRTAGIFVDVDSLLSLPLPKPFDRQERNGIENFKYTIQAIYVGTKKEADQDYHLICTSLTGKPFDAEIPFCDCELNSFILDSVKNVRAVAQTLKAGDKILITGIPFYDKLHGSKGASPVGFEIHPVINLIKQ